MGRNVLFAIGITIVSLAILIPILVVALRDDGSRGVGFGTVLTQDLHVVDGKRWSQLPGVHLADELKCNASHDECSGVIANETDHTVQNLDIILTWKGAGPQTLHVGTVGLGGRAPFSLKLPSRPDDIRDFGITFVEN